MDLVMPRLDGVRAMRTLRPGLPVIFASGYSAGYYAYIWSEMLDAETVEWFTENGGLTRANGDTFRRLLLGVGGSVDALGAFRSLRGRDATIDPLLRRRGLAPVQAG